MIDVEISPREGTPGSPVEYETVISEDGVPQFTSWQPYETPEAAEGIVRKLFAAGVLTSEEGTSAHWEPVKLTVTLQTGETREEVLR